MKILKILFLTLFVFFSLSAKGFAKMTLTADESVAIQQNDQKIVARGNAVAKRDDMQIKAQQLTAKYRKDMNGKMEIESVVAEDEVLLKTPTVSAMGSFMNYDVNKDEVILKGKPAVIKTQDGSIEAQKSIKYYPSKKMAVSSGRVMAVQEKNKIYADKMVSYFDEKNGKMEINKIEIFDNIKITSKDAVITADKGEYLPEESKIKLHKNVVISQNGNVLKGDEAETDLKTGVSKLLSDKKSNGRVSGTFIEKKENKNAK